MRQFFGEFKEREKIKLEGDITVEVIKRGRNTFFMVVDRKTAIRAISHPRSGGIRRTNYGDWVLYEILGWEYAPDTLPGLSPMGPDTLWLKPEIARALEQEGLLWMRNAPSDCQQHMYWTKDPWFQKNRELLESRKRIECHLLH